MDPRYQHSRLNWFHLLKFLFSFLHCICHFEVAEIMVMYNVHFLSLKESHKCFSMLLWSLHHCFWLHLPHRRLYHSLPNPFPSRALLDGSPLCTIIPNVLMNALVQDSESRRLGKTEG